MILTICTQLLFLILDQLTWLAIRSSCSAPSYFRSTGRYLDGGLIANNPTLDAMSEIHKHKKYLNQQSKGKKPTETSKVKIIVSVGKSDCCRCRNFVTFCFKVLLCSLCFEALASFNNI